MTATTEGITIKTDHKWKEFKHSWDVPQRILESQFDYLDNPEDASFIHYRNTWYELGQFVRQNSFPDWDGVHNDSFFSGVLVKLSEDGEQYMIASYYS